MAEVKLSTVWEIKDFASRKAAIKSDDEECIFYSDELTELQHKLLPGLTWTVGLHASSPVETYCRKGFAGFSVCSEFGSSREDAKYAWANYTATLLNSSDQSVATYVSGWMEFAVPGMSDFEYGWVENDAFTMANIDVAVRKNGSLCIRVELSILNIRELLHCRELLSGLLSNQTETDFDVKVDEETFKLHKSVLAETSTVFARMFESGMEEAAEGALILPDTTPVAFKAFTEAIYFDNWDFLSDMSRTQELLYLAEKYNVAYLKRYCDESLAEKVNEANALEVLTKSAALFNAEKTKAACIGFLAENMEFKDSEIWQDFKKSNRGVALEILDIVSDKLSAAYRRVKLDKQQVDAANARLNVDLKRKCDEQKNASSSKRRRK